MPMECITVLIPPKWIELLEDLVREDVYHSRSDAIRDAVRSLLILHGKLK